MGSSPVSTASGVPLAMSRSLPTARSEACSASTLSSRKAARNAPVLGLPHGVAANCRGSKQYTGSTCRGTMQCLEGIRAPVIGVWLGKVNFAIYRKR